jgi:ABC-type glycerol-3-phosphate transport system substrate-binding protein
MATLSTKKDATTIGAIKLQYITSVWQQAAQTRCTKLAAGLMLF